MNPGMPGVGISGLFYVLMVLYMPFRQLVLDRSIGLSGWLFIARHMSYVICMIGVFFVEGIFLKSSAEMLGAYLPTLSNADVILPAATATPFICLGLVIGSVQILRFFFRRRRLYG